MTSFNNDNNYSIFEVQKKTVDQSAHRICLIILSIVLGYIYNRLPIILYYEKSLLNKRIKRTSQTVEKKQQQKL